MTHGARVRHCNQLSQLDRHWAHSTTRNTTKYHESRAALIATSPMTGAEAWRAPATCSHARSRPAWVRSRCVDRGCATLSGRLQADPSQPATETYLLEQVHRRNRDQLASSTR